MVNEDSRYHGDDDHFHLIILVNLYKNIKKIDLEIMNQ